MPSTLLGERDRFAEYRYVITEFYILIGETTEELPIERISDFKIENFFEEASFPIFKVTALMEGARYYNIMRNKDTVKFKVRIQSYYTINGDRKEERSLYRDYINDVFSLFPEDSNENYERDLYENMNDSVEYNELDELTNMIELFLFKDSYVAGLRASFNAELKNCTMSTAVTYLLYKAGVKGCLMAPLDNQKPYASITLPPQSIDKGIRYLNNNYGFHKKGSIVFFGLHHSYILNCKAGCSVFATGEWTETIFCVFEKSSGYTLINGAILKDGEEKYYCAVPATGIDIQSKSDAANVITGTDAITIDMASSKTTKKTSNVDTSVKKNSAVLFNNSSNPYMEETFIAQTNANGTVVTIVVENANLDAFHPNKAFSLVFENTLLNEKYKGIYRIATSIFNFTSTGASYEVTASIVLKKAD